MAAFRAHEPPLTVRLSCRQRENVAPVNSVLPAGPLITSVRKIATWQHRRVPMAIAAKACPPSCSAVAALAAEAPAIKRLEVASRVCALSAGRTF